MAKRPGRSWLPYSHLLLVPFTLVGLDSFGWIFTRPDTAQTPTGLWPRIQAANQPQLLHLYLPPGAAVPHVIEVSSPHLAAPIRLQAVVKDQQWQTQLPALPAGAYQIRLLNQDSQIGPAYQLMLRPDRHQQVRLDRLVHTPGDWLIVSLQQPQPTAIRLEVRGPNQELLDQQALKPGQGVWPVRIKLPEDLQAGTGRVLLWQGQRLLEQHSFKIAMPAASTHLQLIPQQQALLSNFEQTLDFHLLDGAGFPVEGWIRFENQTLSVKQGRASLTLKPEQIRSHYSFNAGDTRGNLLQTPLHFALAQDWLPKRSQDGKVMIDSHQAQLLNWVLGVDKTVISSGIQAIQPGRTEFKLAESLPDQGSLWLRLCDQQGYCQTLRWFSVAQTVNWPIKPAQPHALSPLQVVPLKGLNGQLESFRLQQLGSSIQAPENSDVSGLLQPIGQTEHIPEHPFWLSLWTLLGLGTASLPLISLWHQRHFKQRPFPTPTERKRANRLQRLSLSMSGLGLLAIPLSWIQPLGGVIAAGLGLGLTPLISLFLKPWLHKQHPLLPWFVALHGSLLAIVSWFLWLYQPGVLPAIWLSVSLSGLLLSQFVQTLVPLSQGRQLRQISLAALAVMALIQAVSTARLSQPLPAWRQARSQAVWLEPSLQPLGRLLDHQLLPANSTQVLTPARRSGPQLLIWRNWDKQSISSYQQMLQVGPAVIAEFEPPAFAQLGDQFNLPIRLINETNQAQVISWRLDQAPVQDQQLAAHSVLATQQLFTPLRSGWQTLRLEHRFAGQWHAQSRRIFVQTPQRPVQDPRLHLELELPQSSGLVQGEEIPVLVHLRQSSGRTQALGLQIGLPAGFLALTDTLSDSRHRNWLERYQQTQTSLNLTTQPLASGQEVSFHFRLRAQIPGKMSMPAPRLFFLERPAEQSILSERLQLEVKP